MASEDFVKEKEIKLKEGSSAEPETVAPAIELHLGERYEVRSTIGHGGMGTVYKVLDRSTDQTVAIKIMKSDLANDQSALKRFDQEVEAASNLNHQNLISVYGHGRTEDGAPYMVMEYFEGEGLSDVLKRENHLSPNRALNMFLQICDGLKHAHQQAVIHRDIKPSNIIVSHGGTDSESSKVVDFGIARIVNVNDRHTRSLTETGEVFGSPHYMSPEHCLGFMMDNRSDIYSFGCLMYEVLTGEPPFQANNPIQVVVKHINQEPTRFATANSTEKTMRRLESVVLRCLEKEPDNRYQTIEELEKDLNLVKADKDPSRIFQKKKAKAEFTREQIIVGIAGTLVMIGFGSWFLSSILGGGITGTVLTFMALLITGSGSYYFSKLSLNGWKKLRQGGGTNGAWWQLILQGSLAIFCFLCVPMLVSAIFGIWDVQIFSRGIRNTLAISQGFGCFLLLCAILGWGAFFSERKKTVNGIIVALQCLFIVGLIVGSSLTLFRPQTSRLVMKLSRTLPVHSSETSSKLVSFAIALDPNNIDAQAQAIRTVRISGDYHQAIAMCNELIRSGTGAPAILRQKALADRNLRDYQAAIKDWSSVIAVSQDDDDAYSERARSKYSLGDLQGAIEDYDNAIRYSPNTVRYYQYKAEVHSGLGQYKEALKELDSGIKVAADDAELETFMLRGLIYDRLGQIENAKMNFHQVMRIANESKKLNSDQYVLAAYAASTSGYTNYEKDFLIKANELGSGTDRLARIRLIRVSEIPVSWPKE